MTSLVSYTKGSNISFQLLAIGENIAGLPNAPDKPGKIRLVSSTTDSLTIQWTAPHLNDQDHLFYQLSYFQYVKF